VTPAGGERCSVSPPAAGRLLPWWHGLMALGGLAFGMLGDRRPFGTGVLAHPFVLFFAVVAAALLILRIARARPVPELIPERALVIGCCIGAAAFLVGNWIVAR
jgi:hypothetical protein